MSAPQFTWGKFSRKIIIHKKPEEVFQYIATAEGLTKWLLAAASFFTVVNGTRLLNPSFANNLDSYHWKWKGKDFELEGEVVACEVNKSLTFTFDNAGTVTIEVEDLQGSTLLELTQQVSEGMTYDEIHQAISYAYWTFYLLNLKSVAENGIDLREDSFDAANVLNL